MFTVKHYNFACMFVQRSSLAAELLPGMLLLVNLENLTPLCCYKLPISTKNNTCKKWTEYVLLRHIFPLAIEYHLPTFCTTHSCWHNGHLLFWTTHSDIQQLWNEWLQSPQTTEKDEANLRCIQDISKL